MGNCGTKPATNEGEVAAPEQKAEVIAVESREIVVGEETKVIGDEVAQPPSLGQLILESEQKSITPSEPAKEPITDTTLVAEEVATVVPAKTEEAEPKKEAEPVVTEEEKKKPEEEKKEEETKKPEEEKKKPEEEKK